MLFPVFVAIVIFCIVFFLFTEAFDSSKPGSILVAGLFIIFGILLGQLLGETLKYNGELQQYNCVAAGGTHIEKQNCLTDNNVLIENWDKPKETND
jgi:hypothetical protein